MGQNTDTVRFLDASQLTLASDAATPTQIFHTLNAESGSADNLATLNTSGFTQLTGGGLTFRPFVILIAASGDTITVKHGTGNIELNGAADFALSGNKLLLLFYQGTKWSDVGAGSSGGAPTGAQYLALATDAGLSAERVFTPGDGLSGSDAGANG